MPVAAGGAIGMALRPRGGGRPAEARVGAAAAVLILGSDGVAAAAAAGVVLTVTGTLGGLLRGLGRRRPALGRQAPNPLAASCGNE